MRVFVAGATGAIGRPLVRQLIEAGHEVTGMTRSPDRAENLRAVGATAAVADVFDPDSLGPAIAGTEVLIHQLTAIPDDLDPRKMEAQFEATNRLRTEGTRNLLAAAGEARVIAQSIAFAYAPREGGGPVTEDDPLWTAATPIFAAVKEMEEMVLEAGGLVLRYGFFYGPNTNFAPDGGMARTVRKRQFPIMGGGRGEWPLIHVEDAAAATVAAVDRGASGAYNVVDDAPAPLREWLPGYAEAIGAKRPMRVPKFVARLAAGKIATHYGTTLRGPSNEKAKRELSWSPRYPSWREGFAEGLG